MWGRKFRARGIQPAPTGKRVDAATDELDHYLTRLFLPPASGEEGIASVTTADTGAENLAWLAARYGPVRIVPASRAHMIEMLTARFSQRLADDAVFLLARRFPELSAHVVVTPRQRIILGALVLALAAALFADPVATLRTGIAAMSLAFAASAVFRLCLAFLGAEAPLHKAARADDGALPVYTILVPLYREARVLPDLARALLLLDYPAARLDIKFVVEDDDAETLAAAGRAAALGPFEVIRVPAGLPRTKPKALNYALRFARGEFTVIYDAEDRPEPDQLRKSVAAFRTAPRETACLQARLNFYNNGENWLTRMFALDYALWFDLLLPGLDRIAVPMPLGGTSNHFRTAVLRRIGGWDAFNVTEDADIGIRLSQLGFRVSMLDSTTFEEAPVRFGPWLRQRARWLKGYMQTWLVHVRDPLLLARRIGVGGLLAFQFFIGGAVVSAFVNPFLWTAFLAADCFGWPVFGDFHGIAFAYIPGASLVATNILLTYLAMIGPRRRGWSELSLYGLTVVFYWAMVSIAVYRGFWQLLVRPFHWDKTDHGMSRTAGSPG